MISIIDYFKRLLKSYFYCLTNLNIIVKTNQLKKIKHYFKIIKNNYIK